MDCGDSKTKLLAGSLVFLMIVTAEAAPTGDYAWPIYPQGAVAANGNECAVIGKGILEKNGSAVDAAISTLLCDGTVRPESMGIGGGFLMTIWDPLDGAVFLNAKEVAPAKASENMFEGNANFSQIGGKAIAVPGEIKGLWEAHQKYGRLPWSDLFEPVIELCLEGFVVTPFLYDAENNMLDIIRSQPSLAEFLIDPATDRQWSVGHKLKRPSYANTLRQIAEFGPDIFYNGSMGREVVKEIQESGGIIEMTDLQRYSVKWTKPIATKIDNLTMYTSPPPGSGVILSLIIKVLHGFPPTTDKGVYWQRIVETFKYAYARRSELADPEYVDVANLVDMLMSDNYAETIRRQITLNSTNQDPQYYGSRVEPVKDSGTGNVCVLAPDGSAVAVTSTINGWFGAKVFSKSTGIILNNQMDDFSSPGIINTYNYPPAKANFIRPGKRPLSSTSPTIIVDEYGKVRMIVGCAGGSRIISSVALMIIHHLFSNESVKDAVAAPRIHHQLIPMELGYEPGFDEEALAHLRSIGHITKPYDNPNSSVTAVAQIDGLVTCAADSRRPGSAAVL